MNIRDKEYFLIINPTACSGRAKKEYKIIINKLQELKIKFDYALTQKPKEAIVFSQTAKKENYPIVVAVGGDGTIAEVITGLFLANTTSNMPKLGVIHIGTSPDFNKYHNIPIQIPAAIHTLTQGKTRLIDIGKITYQSFEPNAVKQVTSYFASNVNIGLGPRIAFKANSRYRKYLGDACGTFLALLTSLCGFKKFNLQVDIDGTKTELKNLINFTVGKDPYLASGMRVFNKISPDDGKLYCLQIAPASWIELFINIPKLYFGNFLKYNGARITYANNVNISYCPEHPQVEFDGDAMGILPAEISVMHKALEVITK
ncbi:MAG: YegS/Rv2252/BmrU family lipid kinase [Candidatus Omnitrophica bacterium]|nr:YegS/Rv2252/BmrU family lipid kinase [Candidatus Omnitrophota bacterium]